jgi:cation diffusion facilitator CzcD-associated flavoprotein CzcO
LNLQRSTIFSSSELAIVVMDARTRAVPLKDIPASLPTATVLENVDHVELAKTYLNCLHDLSREDLREDSWWKDLFAFTDTSRTFNGVERVLSAWRELLVTHATSPFKLMPDGSRVMRLGSTSWVQASFTFERAIEPARTGSGSIRLVPDEDGTWKIWIISTMLEQVPDFGNVDVLESQPMLPSDGSGANGHISECTPHRYDTVVVGAGPAGLSTCGRLKALGVSCIALEKYSEIGGNWTNRYETMKLHTSKEACQMPFDRTWGPEYSYFLTAKHLAEGYQRYVKKYDLNVQLSSRVEKASWNEKEETWTITVISKNQTKTLTARHLVLATGATGSIPKMPDLAGKEAFRGEVLHSVDYKNATRWKGKKCVIVGTANTAHDIAENMLDGQVDSVTMVQRSATAVLPIAYYRKAHDPVYNDKISTEVSDRIFLWSTPVPIFRLLVLQTIGGLANQDSKYFDALDRVGFKTQRVCDMANMLYERLGGHYLDVGASAKVAQGLIKMKSDQPLTGFNEQGLTFGDGSTLKADVVVFATGFEGNMRKMAEKFLDEEVSNLTDDCFHVDAEGELIGAWKPMKQPNIWYAAGDIAHIRFFSRFLALQIKADLEGATFRPYLKHKPLTGLEYD